MKPALINYVQYNKMIQEAAYYLWLNGSLDTEANWFNAVAEVNRLQVKSVDITGKLTSYYREHR
jgi:hypothetical protein